MSKAAMKSAAITAGTGVEEDTDVRLLVPDDDVADPELSIVDKAVRTLHLYSLLDCAQRGTDVARMGHCENNQNDSGQDVTRDPVLTLIEPNSRG